MHTAEQMHRQDLERLRALRYMDDDFSCTDPDDMNYDALAKRARYFKQDEEGVRQMCKMLEDMRNEKEKEVRIDNARCMIEDGELSIDKIALYSGLPIDEVKKLAEPVMV